MFIHSINVFVFVTLSFLLYQKEGIFVRKKCNEIKKEMSDI